MKRSVDAPMVHLAKLKSHVSKLVDCHTKKMGFRKPVSFEIVYQMPKYNWNGVAYPHRHLIYFNRKFLSFNYDKYPSAIEWLVVHELIHLILPSDVHHGKEFKKKCVEYGIHPMAINGGNYIDLKGRDRSEFFKI